MLSSKEILTGLVGCCLIGLALAVPAIAQMGGGHAAPPSATEMVANMKKALDLTDEQASQVTSIIQEESNRMETLRQSGDEASVHIQMKTLHQQAESKLMQVLTPAQQTKWANGRAQQRAGRSEGKSPSVIESSGSNPSSIAERRSSNKPSQSQPSSGSSDGVLQSSGSHPSNGSGIY
ncbi:MAG: hypothetical protein HQL22_01295 [Candidatus Omnitrophica bacterium]|nr:hypothetical protein [Candidatus Omnitrophota bacterium]